MMALYSKDKSFTKLLELIVRDNMNVRTKFHGESLNSFCDISLVNLLGAWERTNLNQMIRIYPLWTRNICTFTTIHPRVAEIFRPSITPLLEQSLFIHCYNCATSVQQEPLPCPARYPIGILWCNLYTEICSPCVMLTKTGCQQCVEKLSKRGGTPFPSLSVYDWQPRSTARSRPGPIPAL